MVIRVLQIVSSADTGEQGLTVLARLRAALSTDQIVIISFDGVTTATSSFVNAAFVQLLSSYALSDLQRRLRVVDSTRQINDMIRTRMADDGMAAR